MKSEPARRDDDLNELFARVDRALGQELGARARLRALSTRWRIGFAIGASGALFFAQLLLGRRADFAQYAPELFWAVAACLAAATSASTAALLRGVSVASGPWLTRRGLPLALWLAPVMAALLVPFGSSSLAAIEWGAPLDCLLYGAACAAPVVLLLALFERRDDVPVSVQMTTGALAGVVANLLLHARCPSAHLGHLLLGHASVGVAWSVLLGGWALLRQRLRERPRAGSRQN